MSDSFESHFSETALSHEYSILCNRKYDYLNSLPKIQAGHDGVDYAAFETNKEQRIRAISRQVINCDGTTCRYTFSPFLEKEIPKPNSTSTRTISIGTLSDTLVQQAISRHIEPHIDRLLPDQVYGYRKGKSARQAARHVFKSIGEGNRFVFEADIVKFFDKLDRSMLISMVQSLTIDDRAKKLIRRFLHAYKVEHQCVVQKKANEAYRTTQRVAGVPQGGVLSGMLSNLYLSKLDAALCGFPGYARYADDFVVCCSTLQEAEYAKSIAQTTLESIHLKLHPDKSVISHDITAEPVKFLGFAISTDAIRVHSKNIDKFKASICKVVDSHIVGADSGHDLRRLLRRIRYKVCGPEREDLCSIHSNSTDPMLYRRCWIGFFRCITDIPQIKMLDKFILGRISYYARSKHGIRLKRKQIRAWGLPSLVSTYYKSRRGIPARVRTGVKK